MSDILIHGVVLSNYRAFGDDPEFIGPFGVFNFIVGPNNSGKSCLLRFLSHHIGMVTEVRGQAKSASLDPLDVRVGAQASQVRMGIAVPKRYVIDRLVLAKPEVKRSSHFIDLVNKIFDFISDDIFLWVRRSADGRSREFFGFDYERNIIELKGLADASVWQGLWIIMSGKGGGGWEQHWIPETIYSILKLVYSEAVSVSMIPAIRVISPSGQDFSDWSGKGLIDELVRLQNPGVMERSKLEKFNRINSFLAVVTQRPGARIEIPHDREHVLVHMDKKVLPLESLGMGIHEVVMLAAFCTLMDSQVVCIEEPEVHLHPLLQKRLIKYLKEETNNQYFIATHSASMIDADGVSIFRVSGDIDGAKIIPVSTDSERFEICQELGYKASDIIQANSVVWVEGPSDRIYINHWISSVAPDLVEGIDYSIMFYGGRLLSHLHAGDSEQDVENLIEVRKINRNSVVVIDSDMDSPSDTINDTKRRIVSELAGDGFSWVTAGREIENYVSEPEMTSALLEIYGDKYSKRHKKGQYDHVLPFKGPDGKVVSKVDKVKVAKSVCSKPNTLSQLDLQAQLEALVAYIRKASAGHA